MGCGIKREAFEGFDRNLRRTVFDVRILLDGDLAEVLAEVPQLRPYSSSYFSDALFTDATEMKQSLSSVQMCRVVAGPDQESS